MSSRPFKGVPTYGPKQGKCNICCKFGKLTFDHVPPKGSTRPEPMELHFLMDLLEKKERFPRRSQSGVRFRTLCEECNRDRLGSEYDPELKQLATAVAQHLRIQQLGLSLPRFASFRLKPQRVARAVVGHLLAADLREDMDKLPKTAPLPDKMREYFLDPSAPLPSEITIYVWPYPSDQQAILQNVGVSRLGAGVILVSHFIKFFPLGFWLIFNRPPTARVRLRELVADRRMRLDDHADLKLDFLNTPRADWPENPDDDEFSLLVHETAYVAKRRSNARLSQRII